jgi:molybdopterin molybdotransferase
MKQLSNDCFDHGDKRLRHAEALDLLRQRISPITGIEDVELSGLLGRVLAGPVIAPHPVPNHTNSAVDGFAFPHAAYAGDDTSVRLPLAGRAAAGHPLSTRLAGNAAIRIFTGAMLPDGTDTVAMQEDCEHGVDDTPFVLVPAGLRRGANVRQAGEDVGAGSTLYPAGHTIRPQDLAAIASIGLPKVSCRTRLRIGIVSTGDEVIPANGHELPPGKVFDANAPMLMGLTTHAGAIATDLGIWPDNAEGIESKLAEAAHKFDVILTSGGASRGEEDHMAAALARLGNRHFWQIDVKPGRPMMMGTIADTPVVGLPGNPVAVFVCFLVYVWPMLRSLSGAPWHEPRRIFLPAEFRIPRRKTGRREFWRGILVGTGSDLRVAKFERDGSGLISSLREADCLIDVPEELPAVELGDPIGVIPFAEYGFPTR